MAKSKIFIASSGRTLQIARQLRDSLKPEFCDAELWSEASERYTGKSILAMLRSATKDYDFALIILAKDDVVVSEVGEKMKARDNCVFEAGLFIGALGEDRCFLLSSVPEQDLPSDLSGIIYIPFSEPTDLDDLESCRKAIRSASTRVDGLVQRVGPMTNRPLTPEKLLEKAKRVYEGGELQMDQVVVASVQPMDVDYIPAKQVRKNIDAGNIRYFYFFQGNSDGAEKTCQLLQMVLLADILKSQKEADDFRGCVAKILENKDQILNDLKRICQDERIKVFFLPAAPALQYSIHNAASDKFAKLYLKHDEEYIEWASGREAYEFWDEIRQGRGANDPVPPKALLYGAPGFMVNDRAFSSTLNRAAAIYFRGIHEEVMKMCIEGPE